MSQCHKSPSCRPILHASLCRRMADTEWTQDCLHSFKPRLSATNRPSSPICSRVCNAKLQSSVVVLAWTGTDEMANKGQMSTPDCIWQQQLPSTEVNLINGNKYCKMDVEDVPKILTKQVHKAKTLENGCNKFCGPATSTHIILLYCQHCWFICIAIFQQRKQRQHIKLLPSIITKIKNDCATY